ncbi:exonuclease mut-7 homolog [Schistocerca americana]|uniref:exonuclease mut-7 homolog n=1 Tax=Schistocerca americana TaxID=7009 RepID=UPI001F4F8B23|nr:exonuclease mut-7 homolog [Schistocerca americana]XP_046996047.1 exonuclease mut-7 homolog [Schistocerca americana]XP_046996048.1 exonuclease mut-7 homolog [Schistocerca americana]XP_046996049.1 exonuclease mut-7 homolog [Schistocerca americana]
MAYGGRGRGGRRDGRWIDSSLLHQYHDESQGFHQPDDALSAWIKQLIEMWRRWKKSDAVRQMLHNCFAAAGNPYITALQIMLNSEDFYQAKTNSLAYTVMEEFSVWLDNHRQYLDACLTRELKFEAFLAVQMQRNHKLVKLVYATYEMAQDSEIFYDEIMKMVSKRLYKEACQSATLLKLHDYFAIEDFIIPLALQDKMSIAEEFLSGSVPHQKKVVIFLDKLLEKRALRNEVDSIAVKLKVPDVKLDKFHYKPLSKLVGRLVKMYNLPEEICPNLNQRRNEGALQFLLHKRYQDNSLGTDSWREMVREAVQDDVRLQEELIVLVNLANDPEEALYWTNYYNIPQSKWPENVRIYSQERKLRLQREKSEETEENWDNSLITYHQLALPFDSIIFVDSDEKLQLFIESVKKNHNMHRIGIDCEWKPRFGTKQLTLALMQIATSENVYILDVIRIGLHYKELWEELGRIVFSDESIMKLAFSYVGDMAMIKNSLPHLYPFLEEHCELLDVSLVWQQLVKKHSIIFPYNGSENTSGESLSRLVELCKGHPLDKSDQFSNWEQRPLRRGQLVYAALDAYCLLEVFDVMEQCCAEQGIPFLEICNSIIQMLKSPKKVPKSTKKTQKEIAESPLIMGPPPFTEPVPARSLRIVCDMMVAGLGLQLRMCGIDTVILKAGQNYDQCVRIAMNEDRMVITRGKNIYRQMSQHLPMGHCYLVSEGNLEKQLKEVLEYFNVTVTKKDVFSRCKICNGDTFIKVTRNTMQQLAENYRRLSYTVPEEAEAEDEEEVEVEEAGFDSEGFSSEDDMYTELIRPPCYTEAKVQNVQDGIIMSECKTQKGAAIQIGIIPEPILQREKEYLICDDCGRCYWCGSHFSRALNSTLKDIVKDD